MNVTAAERARYWLVVWVGDEVKPILASAVGAPEATANASSPVQVVTAFAVIAGIILLSIVIVRRRRGGKS